MGEFTSIFNNFLNRLYNVLKFNKKCRLTPYFLYLKSLLFVLFQAMPWMLASATLQTKHFNSETWLDLLLPFERYPNSILKISHFEKMCLTCILWVGSPILMMPFYFTNSFYKPSIYYNLDTKIFFIMYNLFLLIIITQLHFHSLL